MIRAIQDGTKCETRRFSGLEKINEQPSSYTYVAADPYQDEEYQFLHDSGYRESAKPRYRIGDKVYIGETFYKNEDKIVFKSDEIAAPENIKWKSGMFLKEQDSRYKILITDVKVERLKDISHDSAVAEGVLLLSKPTQYKDYSSPNSTKVHDSPILSFFSLIDSIASTKVDKNKFVFVYKFNIIKS